MKTLGNVMDDKSEGQNRYLLMLQTMVAIAKSDGNVQPCERERILNLMNHLHVKERDQNYVKQLLSEDSTPALPGVELLPSYNFRRYLFQQVLLVAYDDGLLHRQETVALANLAELLGLEPEHQEQAWRTARDLMDN